MLRLLWLRGLGHLRRERAAARRLHWVTILRSRELGMMDLELTRWKRVGLFYKQLNSSPQTVFLNSVFPVRTAGFLGLLAALGEGTEKAPHPLEGLLWPRSVLTAPRDPCHLTTALGRGYSDHTL